MVKITQTKRMVKTFEKQQKLSVYEFDSENKLKANALFNYIQDIAAEHAESLYVGRKDLEQWNLFWVLSWVKVKILSYPKFGESIRIKTWPKRQHRLFSLRDLLFYNQNDEVFAKVTTAWLLVNANTMRATSVESLPIPINYHPDEEALSETPDKISALTENKKLVFQKNIKYSDIDVNKHVNNAKYVEYLLDCYSKSELENRWIKEITLSFLAEAKFDDTITIFREKLNETSDIFEAFNKDSQKIIFKAIIDWN